MKGVAMDLRVDQKGKFYTPRVSKETIAVLIRTSEHLIVGSIFVRPGYRVSDELNDPKLTFLSVTNARVYDAPGVELLYATGFLLVSAAQVVMLTPLEDLSHAADAAWARDLPVQE